MGEGEPLWGCGLCGGVASVGCGLSGGVASLGEEGTSVRGHFVGGTSVKEGETSVGVGPGPSVGVGTSGGESGGDLGVPMGMKPPWVLGKTQFPPLKV